jgi:hypothetical protein
MKLCICYFQRSHLPTIRISEIEEFKIGQRLKLKKDIIQAALCKKFKIWNFETSANFSEVPPTLDYSDFLKSKKNLKLTTFEIKKRDPYVHIIQPHMQEI